MSHASNGNGKRINHSTLVLLVLASIAITVMYVESMAFPSLPKVMEDFGLTPADYALASWVITIYLIVGAVAIPVFGKLGDIYGKKKMLLITMSIYTVAVTLTGFSKSISEFILGDSPNGIYIMIGFRAIQGLAMCMFPLAFSLIRDEFPRDKIAIAQGVISAMFGVGTAVGFVLGGWVTDKLGWDWTYHTVIPFVLLSTVIVGLKVRESPVRLKAKIDYIGAGLLAITLTSFLVAVTETRNRGWEDSFVVSLLVVSVASVLTFAYWQTRAKEPLVRPALMKERNIALTNIIGFIIGFALFTANQTIAALAGFNFGLDAIHIGLLMLPMSVITLVLGPTVGFIVRRFGPKWPMAVGILFSIAGYMVLYQYHASQLQVMLGVSVMGSGGSFAMVGSINMVIISTPKLETGISTAMNMIVRTSGSVVGPALAAVIISNYSHFVPGVGVVPEDSAYRLVFLMSSVVMGVGVIVSLLLTNKKAMPEEEPSAASPAEQRPAQALKGIPAILSDGNSDAPRGS
ncbi:MAG: MFS transporter [Thermoplasmata archaeon]